MKVLWLCNLPTPDISEKLGASLSSGGGWIASLYDIMVSKNDIELFYVFPYGVDKETKGKTRSEFFGFSILKGKPTKYNPELEETFREYLLKINPDIIHIFGTEFAHQLSMTKAALGAGMQDRIVVSIQGLISYIAKHYTQGLSEKTIRGWTLRDLLRKDNILNQQRAFEKRGEFEKQTLSNVNHIIGRTTWDRACTNQINENANYYHIDETLRSGFYKKNWSFDKCKKHSIFISTADYPVKGAHYIIKAMPYVLKRFKDAHLYIAGRKFDTPKSIKSRLKLSSYPKHILDLIERLGLSNKVTFLGPLSEEKMIAQYLKSHVFVSPSVIENSPNSVCEAMLLGVPVVASSVGGVTDLLEHKKEGFIYQSTAEYMLSHYICEIFSSKATAELFSKNAKARAKKTHDIQKNADDVLKLYNDIAK